MKKIKTRETRNEIQRLRMSIIFYSANVLFIIAFLIAFIITPDTPLVMAIAGLPLGSGCIFFVEEIYKAIDKLRKLRLDGMEDTLKWI